MLIHLPLLSFFCAGLLIVFLFILLRRPTVNTPNLSLVVWLIFGNTVHAVNALVWSSNVELRIPVWCDIVTKLLVGANMALPGVCVCSARYLELLSSNRKIYPNTYSKRLHTLLDVALCYVLPLLYMILHFAVQDHRFDLVQDFGCSASIHRSTPAVILMVIPPLIISIISLVLCLFSVYNCAKLSSDRFSSHLRARSSVSMPRFIRRLTVSILLTSTVLLVTLFPLLFLPSHSWTSFASVHENFGDIFVVKAPDAVKDAQLVWWSIPVVSIVFLLLYVALGDETVDVLNWIRRRCGSPPPRPTRPQLTLLTFNHSMVSKSSMAAPSPASAQQEIQLRSGWDDMLDVKSSSRRGSGFFPNRKSVVSSSSGGSSSPSTSLADDAFTSSTLTYLASPVALALGLPSPRTGPGVASPPPVYYSTGTTSPVKANSTSPRPHPPRDKSISPHPLPPRDNSRSPKLPTSGSPHTHPHPPRDKSVFPKRPLHLFPPRQPIPEDTSSTISSIWEVPWPLPPPTSPSRRGQSSGAAEQALAYPMYSPIEPPRTPPLGVPRREGSSVPGRGMDRVRGADATPRVPNRKASMKGLRRTWSRERMNASPRGYATSDIIYMTRTVEETTI